MALIEQLPNDKLDIIGDVHGQFSALQQLLKKLGYRADGYHRQHRKLVFVGDLVDRGPQIPELLAWFEHAQRAGYAFMVLGNHELNLLTDQPKDGSGWYFDCRAKQDESAYAPWQRLSAYKKPQVFQFLSQQPIVLQRHDIRIVHACWLDEAVAKIQACNHDNVVQLYQDWESDLRRQLSLQDWYADYVSEQKQHAFDLASPSYRPPMLPATALCDVYQNRYNPLRVLTHGVEATAEAPFYAGGKWRFSCRQAWWNDYQADVPVVIGHYWRQWYPNPSAHERELFSQPPHHWHGIKRNVFCCDFSVGARWRDRHRNIAPAQSRFRLASLRWDEKELVFDNGDVVMTQ